MATLNLRVDQINDRGDIYTYVYVNGGDLYCN